jgi:tRNA (mo5U34)-methyltransferase
MSYLVLPIPPAPPGFDPQRFFEGNHWHQRWEMFQGVFTPGHNPIDAMCDDMQLPHDLRGKRVLDIGAWNGCLSFECERRGAAEVIALSPEEPEYTGFERLRQALGSTRTHYRVGSVYNLDPAELGYFDVVLFCGVLYHLRYPLLGIDNLRRVARGDIYIETLVSNWYMTRKPPPTGWHAVLRSLRALWRPPQPLPPPVAWRFFRGDEYEGDPSNWFAPTPDAVAHAFESAGFAVRMITNTGRATFRGHVKHGVPEFLRIGSGEGVFYDSVVRNLFGAGRHGFGSEREQTQSAVLSSAAYYQRTGGTPAPWVSRVWSDLLGRPPSAAEHEAARQQLADNTPLRRQAVVLGVLSGVEYRTRWIAGAYRQYLGREASPFEQKSGIWTWRQKGDDEDLIVMLLGSEEYFQRVGGTNREWLSSVYRLLFDRERDAGSEGFLVDLDKGVSRGCVVFGLLDSAEFRQRLLTTLWHAHVGPAHPVPESWLEALACPAPAAQARAA